MRSAFRVLRITAFLVFGACHGDYGGAPEQRALTTVNVRLPLALELGQLDTAVVTVLDQYGAPIAVSSVSWSSSRPEIVSVSPTTGAMLAIAPGSAVITASVDGKTAQKTVSVFASPIRLNEVRPDGSAREGWLELFNPSEAPIDLSGWTLTNGDVFRAFGLPSGTTIPAGGFLIVDETSLPGGLGSADAVHVFSRFGVQVDAFAWTTDVNTSFGRCPDRTGSFVTTTTATRGAANSCL